MLTDLQMLTKSTFQDEGGTRLNLQEHHPDLPLPESWLTGVVLLQMLTDQMLTNLQMLTVGRTGGDFRRSVWGTSKVSTEEALARLLECAPNQTRLDFESKWIECVLGEWISSRRVLIVNTWAQ